MEGNSARACQELFPHLQQVENTMGKLWEEGKMLRELLMFPASHRGPTAGIPDSQSCAQGESGSV